jgi:hypothetical protein
MTPPTRRLAAVAVAACLASACTSTASSSPTTAAKVATTTTIKGAKTPAETGAATLRAGLTALTTANIYLTSVATSAAVNGADPSPAVAAVNANSHELATLFGTQYGAAPVAAFERVWSRQTALFVAYARATAANDAAAASAAPANFDKFRTDLEAFLLKTNIYLLKGDSATPALDDDLSTTNSAMLALIDAQAARSPTQYDKLATAAARTPHLAIQLAAATAKQFPNQYPGTPTGSAANLRASLTASFVAHSYLLGIATATSLGGGNVAPATATLESNTHELANAFASVFGDSMGSGFATLWTGQIQTFLAYAGAVSTGDRAAQDKATAALSAFGSAFGGLISSIIPALTADQVAAAIATHVGTTLPVINAQAARDAAQFDLLRSAAEQMPAIARQLSEAIAEQFPLRYLP